MLFEFIEKLAVDSGLHIYTHHVFSTQPPRPAVQTWAGPQELCDTERENKTAHVEKHCALENNWKLKHAVL